MDYPVMTDFQAYLINVGIRSSEYSYTDDDLFNNVEYFQKCFNDHLSAYKALLFLHDYLKGDFTLGCECKQEWLTHHYEADAFPYGDTIEYDICNKCGKQHNFKVRN